MACARYVRSSGGANPGASILPGAGEEACRVAEGLDDLVAVRLPQDAGVTGASMTAADNEPARLPADLVELLCGTVDRLDTCLQAALARVLAKGRAETDKGDLFVEPARGELVPCATASQRLLQI